MTRKKLELVDQREPTGVELQIEEAQEENWDKVQKLLAMGVGVHPLAEMGAKLDVLIAHVAENEPGLMLAIEQRIGLMLDQALTEQSRSRLL